MIRQRVLLLPLLQTLLTAPCCSGDLDRCDQLAAQLEAQLAVETIADRAELRGIVLAYWQDATLLVALRDPNAPEYSIRWQAVRAQVRYALRLLGRDCAQEDLVLRRLGAQLGNYNFHSRLETWIAVRVVYLAQACESV
jgi:hypothetical protein